MNNSTSNSAPFYKVKSILSLGLSCNITTLIGCIAVWVALTKFHIAPGGMSTALLVFCYAPIFMADAISIYVLGRIRLEQQNNWCDVQITNKARATVSKLYVAYRAISVIPAYLLASTFIAAALRTPQVYYWLRIAFLVTFSLHLIRTLSFIYLAIVPVLKEKFGGKKFLNRSLLAIVCSSAMIYLLFSHKAAAYSHGEICLFGFYYFILSAILHPLPTHYSLLGKRSEALWQVYTGSPESFMNEPDRDCNCDISPAEITSESERNEENESNG